MRFLVILIACLGIFFSTSVIAKGFIKSNKINFVAFQTMYGANWGNPSTCSQSNAIVLSSNDPNYDKAYALLLAAYMSGKKISGYSDNCITHDGQTYNTIRGFKYLTITD